MGLHLGLGDDLLGSNVETNLLKDEEKQEDTDQRAAFPVMDAFNDHTLLTADDLKEALFALFKIAQIESFKRKYKDLQASWALSSKSPLLPLRPVLTEGIARVGGHLDEALIPFEG